MRGGYFASSSRTFHGLTHCDFTEIALRRSERCGILPPSRTEQANTGDQSSSSLESFGTQGETLGFAIATAASIYESLAGTYAANEVYSEIERLQ